MREIEEQSHFFVREGPHFWDGTRPRHTMIGAQSDASRSILQPTWTAAVLVRKKPRFVKEPLKLSKTATVR
jgi:hypothetical protein